MRLAVGDSEGRVLLIRTDGTQPHTLQGASSVINALAWSPDDRRVAAGCHTGDIHLWETAGEHLAVVAAYDGEIHSLVFHPEGQWLVTGKIDGSRFIDVTTRQFALIDSEKWTL
jgi:WD40 repeat protein